MKIEEKRKSFQQKLDEIDVLETALNEDGGDTTENRDKFKALLTEADVIRKSIETDETVLGLKNFAKAPANESKAYGRNGDGATAQPFVGQKSVGELFLDAYQEAGANINAKVVVESKGFLNSPGAFKATFDSTSTGLDTSRNYVTPPGGMVLIEQQRLTIRDLLSVGETSQGIIYYPKESSFTNGADMVAEEGEKPEATLATTAASAPVKKIAVLLKVSDEMWNDFPMLRDYVNTRGRFMVEQKEEDQLLNGTGVGNQITGILNSSPQTQAKGGDTNLDAIHKAITKIRIPASNVGGYEPDAIVMHPTDYQLIRLAKDSANQYYGGGPFMGLYGNGGYPGLIGPWGLKVVVTTAITAGTALVGAFKLGAQIWQREGIRVETFDQHEDDVAFNRKTIRIEERLALAVYRPSAFCTVTSIA